LTALKSIIEYLDVSDCDMEKGSLRCDANVSIRKTGEIVLGTKTELKNMNSFKGVKDALTYEIQRQAEVLAGGGAIIQQTMLWDVKENKTVVMRTKEEAKDYRYFPEPDLPQFLITKEKIEEIKKTIPELPEQRCQRIIREYALTEHDANILVISKADADYAEECMKKYKNSDKKPIVNLLIGPLFSEANIRNTSMHALGVSSEDLLDLLGFIDRDEISNLNAKAVLKEMIETKNKAAEIVKTKNLVQISDSVSLDKVVDEVIQANIKSVEDFRAGKVNALMFLVGQVMKKSSGKANPKIVQDILKRRLS